MSEQYDVSVSAVDSGIRRMIDQLEANPRSSGCASRDESGFADEKPTTGKLIYTVKNYLQRQRTTEHKKHRRRKGMEQMRQNDAGALTAQAIPQKDVEQACFHALGLDRAQLRISGPAPCACGADQQTRQAVNDISAAAARLDRTVNEVMSLLDFLRTEEAPRGSIRWTCASCCSRSPHRPIWCRRSWRGVELTLDYGGWTACRIMADRSDAELLCLHLLSNASRACVQAAKCG